MMPANKNFLFWQDFSKVRVSLNKVSPIFYALAQLGTVFLDTSVSTFSLSYNTEGYALDWRINLRFWNSLDRKQKQFFICHECLHFILEHGKRLNLKDPVSNVAADIVVNEMLLSDFEFSKEDLKDLYSRMCFVDTICSDLGYGYPVEYYVKKLSNQENKDFLSLAPSNHLVEKGIQSKKAKDTIDKKIERSIQNLTARSSSRGERQKIQKHLHAIESYGDLEGGLVKKISSVTEQPQNRWLRVIREKVKSFSSKESWALLNRRTAFFETELFIPTEYEDEMNDGKINLLFYIDSSGSCWEYAQRFVQAANSIPKSKFNIEIFTFDVNVYPYNNNTVLGGGGTSLRAVVEHAERQKFKAAFVLTDGEGIAAFPKEKKKWSWFLTKDGTSKHILGGAVYPLDEYA